MSVYAVPSSTLDPEGFDQPSPLVGREQELALIDSLLTSSGLLSPGLLLRGGPGTGKSALLEQAAARAGLAGVQVLRASGVEREAGLDYSGLHQLLHPIRSQIARLPIAERVALQRAFGLADGPVPSRLVISAATLALIQAAAAKGPILLAVDDVQSLDPSSLTVLGFVARRLGGQPVALLVTHTAGAEPAFEPVGLLEHELAPLSELAAARLLLRRNPHLEPGTLRRLLDQAGGIPRMLRREGRLELVPDRVDNALDHRSQLHVLLRREPDPAGIAASLEATVLLSLDRFVVGHWEQAETLARNGLTRAEAGGCPLLGHWLRYSLALLAAGRGDGARARSLADQMIGWAAPRRIDVLQTLATSAVTLAAMAEADFETGYTLASRLNASGVLAPGSTLAARIALDLAEAGARIGRVGEAGIRLAAVREAGVTGLCALSALLVQAAAAVCGTDAEAGKLYRAALSVPGADRFIFEYARVELIYGEWLRRTRDTSAARIQLRAALDRFTRLGARSWARRAANELRAAGVDATSTGLDPVRRLPANTRDLTSQQLQIAGLAAEGLTNKQIGERLFLSHRTVGTHLYKVYPKLGISSRAGLRQALDRRRSGADLPS